MKQMNSNQRRRTERAMIDALLKISEIVKKTEKQRAKKSIGDGDKIDYSTGGEVPMPPPMRTLDSYVSTFNQQPTQQPSNCNRATVEKPMANGKRARCDDVSSSSTSTEKVGRSKRKSVSAGSQPLENPSTITTCQSQTTSYHVNSAATTLLDDQSSSNIHNDFNALIDEQLQKTLENQLRTHLMSPDTLDRNLSKQHKAKLTRSETGKLIDRLDLSEANVDVERYEKQRRSAMLAAKEGNYALSHRIYTNLLHDPQYDSQMKSEILASRATTLLLEEKCFQSIDDCTRAIAYNQWNKLAYVVRAACWMIKQEYGKALDDYSRLFHFFDQSEHVLDLLNLAYEKYKTTKEPIDDDQSIRIEQEQHVKLRTSPATTRKSPSSSLALASPVASFVQPAVYLCYPYPSWYSNSDDQCPPTLILPNASQTSDMANEQNNNASTTNDNNSELIWIRNPLTKIYS